MERYYLFRGNELIYSTDGSQIGAGVAHELGQPGDVLIRDEFKILSGFHWNKIDIRSSSMPWQHFKKDELDQAKYRVLLLLQQ